MRLQQQVAAFGSIIHAVAVTARPAPTGEGDAEVEEFRRVLEALRGGAGLADVASHLDASIDGFARVRPDRLSPVGALAFWIDLYNLGALRLALDAERAASDSVLAVPGGFRRPFVVVDSEALSLDMIEHGKVRRFRDPRVHAAMVCSAASCPPLAPEPFTGTDLDATLDARMRRFVTVGGVRIDVAQNTIRLSKIFRWFGADFCRPSRMPTVRPASPGRVLAAIVPWMDDISREWVRTAQAEIVFDRYDWSLRAEVDGRSAGE